MIDFIITTISAICLVGVVGLLGYLIGEDHGRHKRDTFLEQHHHLDHHAD